MALVDLNGNPLSFKKHRKIEWKPDTDPSNEINNVSIAQQWHKDNMQRLEKIVSEDKRFKENYYISIFAKADPENPHLIRQKFFVSESKPQPMFGCQCYYIDKKRGRIVCEYILPLDCPTMDISEYLQNNIPMPEVIGYLKEHNITPVY